MSESIETIGTLFFWLILLGVATFIFFIIMSFLIQVRKVLLQNQINSIPSNQLKINFENLDNLNDLIKNTWEKRYNIYPEPSQNHITKGWIIKEDNSPINIKTIIKNSINVIENEVLNINKDYKRIESFTISEYLKWLSKKKDLNLSKKNIENYLLFFNSARYGQNNFQFNEIDLSNFNKLLNDILNNLKK